MTKCLTVLTTHCRKEALDKLCKEKIVEGMERAAKIASDDDSDCEHADYHAGCCAGYYIADSIRQAAKDPEDS